MSALTSMIQDRDVALNAYSEVKTLEKDVQYRVQFALALNICSIPMIEEHISRKEKVG